MKKQQKACRVGGSASMAIGVKWLENPLKTSSQYGDQTT